MSERTGKLIMAGFIGFIMMASTVGFVYNFSGASFSSAIYYNGHKFEQLQNGYSVEIDGVELTTNFFPSEIDYIDVDPAVINLIKNTPIVRLTSNFSSNYSELIAYSAFELTRALEPLNIYAPAGFIEETELDTDVITCEMATEFVPVIYFKTSDRLRISQNKSCIIVEADDALGFVRLKDRLIYGVYGIIE